MALFRSHFSRLLRPLCWLGLHAFFSWNHEGKPRRSGVVPRPGELRTCWRCGRQDESVYDFIAPVWRRVR